jgi:hypothetical protein
VSFSWKQFFSAKPVKSLPWREIQRAITSWRLAEARKYCWRSLSSLPLSLASLG